jgi:sulfide:quinone oxidoreductase
VLVAGAGVAGLETLLALRALAGDRIDVTLLAPELKFVNSSMSAAQPFTPRRARGVRIQDIAIELGARWHRGTLDRVEHARRRAVTRDDDRLAYEMLVLAVGARPGRAWNSTDVLTFHGGNDGPDYELLLHRLDEGRVKRVAFVKPAGPSWPLPLYELALMTAARCSAHGLSGVELNIFTPEEMPLGIFGKTASVAVGRLLRDSGVAVHTSSYAVPSAPGWLDITPGEHQVAIDRVVTVPSLVGPRLRGMPCDPEGFLQTDAHGRIVGVDGVFAAGDATTFSIKQGGLATQQADAVAEAIAASVGVELDPQPFRPILREVLLTGGPARYLRADISGAAGDDSTISQDALWWPPDKLAARHLAPFLSSQLGDAGDVVPHDEHAVPGKATLETLTRGEYRGHTAAIS